MRALILVARAALAVRAVRSSAHANNTTNVDENLAPKTHREPSMTKDLLALAERCEQAAAEQQRDLLEEAWWALSGMASSRARGLAAIDQRFLKMLEAEAYESAAMTLVPEGMDWQVGHGIETEHGGRPSNYAWCGEGEGELRFAATPALALCAAALRTIKSQGGTR
jgi:hypothetical protein